MTMDNPAVKFCPKCGHPIEAGMKFCMNCGEKLPVLPVQESAKPAEVNKEKTPVSDDQKVKEKADTAKPVETKTEESQKPAEQNIHQQTNKQSPQPTVSAPYNQAYINPCQIPLEYQPVSAWEYLGYELLFLIPVAGFVIMIVMCFALTNKNVKNFARAHVLLLIIAIVIMIIIAVTVGESLDYLFEQFNV